MTTNGPGNNGENDAATEVALCPLPNFNSKYYIF